MYNQLLSITHEIYKFFDDGLEVNSVFLDKSKAFDKRWHDEFIFKLEQNGIFGDLLNILRDFRKQRVFLNGQVSTGTSVNAGVPRGSMLSPLLLLIYINDLSDNSSSNVKLFTDDTSLFSVIHVNVSAGELGGWAFQWKMIFNPDASKQAQEVIFNRKIKKTTHLSMVFNNAIVSQTNSQKHLGVTIDLKLTFEEHPLNVF